MLSAALAVDHRDVDRIDDDAERRVAELIGLGRDREAIALAIGEDLTNLRGGIMDTRTQLEQLGPVLAGVVDGIQPEHLDLPTRSTAFTVRGVLEHMVGGATMFTAAFRGEEPGEPQLDDVLSAFGPTLGNLVEAMQSSGALDRTIAAPFGEVPGDTFARFVILDGLVHGWDMATATGQSYDPPADLVEAASSFAEATLDPLRDGESFAEAKEAPADATPIERLVAYTGRAV
jgi:uncharacterized protein (TIGR03086 family)